MIAHHRLTRRPHAGRFGRDHEARMGREQLSQALADERMVIDDQNALCFHHHSVGCVAAAGAACGVGSNDPDMCPENRPIGRSGSG